MYNKENIEELQAHRINYSFFFFTKSVGWKKKTLKIQKQKIMNSLTRPPLRHVINTTFDITID